MKRYIVRLSVLAGVLGLGWIAIAQAQKAFTPTASTQEPKKLPETPAGSPAARPIPLAAEEASPGVADPFNNARAMRRTALQEEAPPQDRYGDRASTRYADSPIARTEEIPSAQEALVAEPSNAQAVAEPRGYRLRGEPASPRGGDPFGLRAAPPAADRAATGQAVQETAQVPTEAPVEPATLPEATEARRPLRGMPAAEPEAIAPPAAPVATPSDNFAPPAATDRYVPQGNVAPPAGLPTSPSDNGFAASALPAGGNTEGTGRPGAQQLEGVQAPTLTIEKTAPAEIQVGKPATFTIRVRNKGSVVAHGVQVHDQVPKGTQLVSTNPPAARDDLGGLVFDLGTLKAGEEATAQVQLMPLTEGEIGSLATVHFRAEASVRTVATKPELRVELVAPAKVMIGGAVPLQIKITNPGSGAASGVVLTEVIPAGLKHTAGSELEFEVGTLKPGETRELELSLTAAAAGLITNTLSARGEANLKAQASVDVEVIAPALKVGMSGPKRRYLERNATYQISVSNPGTAPAKDVELVSALPKGLKFVEANNAGQYDAATHSVYWSLEELPAQETGTVTMTALPVEPGEFKLQIRGQAKQGLSDQLEEVIAVDGLAAIQFELVDVNDPIEVNGQTTYEIRVTNSGSKAASNLRLVALLPPEMKALSAEGPAKHVIDGPRVLFDPVRQLAPKADTSYLVKVQGLKAGDLRIRVQIVTDEITTPITKEESTRVYTDE